MARRLAALALLGVLALPAPAPAQTAREVREAERQAEERRRAAEEAAAAARAAALEEQALAERRVAAAQRAQEAEATLLAARERLEAARAAEQAALAELAARAAALRPLVPAMLRLSMFPAETVFAVPAPPEEALRGALVLRSLSRRLADEAAALRQAGAEARRLARTVEREAEALAQAEAEARSAAEAVEAELALARSRLGQAEAAEQRAARQAEQAAARASDLAEALERLERERARAEAAAARAARAREARRARQEAEEQQEAAASTPAPAPRGGRALPVAGRIVTGFGESTAAGVQRGLTFSAAPAARVVSPCGGRAVFAAPFRTFGLLLIVDCGGGYHFVLAGLERLDVRAGQNLLAGEPVGVLPGGSGGPLYLELRRGGQPVDPRPWFAARG